MLLRASQLEQVPGPSGQIAAQNMGPTAHRTDCAGQTEPNELFGIFRRPHQEFVQPSHSPIVDRARWRNVTRTERRFGIRLEVSASDHKLPDLHETLGSTWMADRLQRQVGGDWAVRSPPVDAKNVIRVI